jgi:hypothetical protein
MLGHGRAKARQCKRTAQAPLSGKVRPSLEPRAHDQGRKADAVMQAAVSRSDGGGVGGRVWVVVGVVSYAESRKWSNFGSLCVLSLPPFVQDRQ